jgi:hypothetical protein
MARSPLDLQGSFDAAASLGIANETPDLTFYSAL